LKDNISRNPIATRLKEARIAAKISQRALGMKAGIDASSVSPRMSQYETGRHVPDFLILKRIGKVLGYPTAYFYADNDCLAEMIVLFSNLNKDQKTKILGQLRRIKLLK